MVVVVPETCMYEVDKVSHAECVFIYATLFHVGHFQDFTD